MYKSSLKTFLAVGVACLGTAVYAAAPVLGSLPVIVISDIENNSGTLDNNLFVFTDAFLFDDFDSDQEDDAVDAARGVGLTLLKWSFFIDPLDTDNTGSISINGFGPVADIADADNPVNPINFMGSPFDAGNAIDAATVLEDTLSPGGGGAAPHPDPTAIGTSLQGAPADIDGDSVADTLVGELDVLFIVADSDQQTASRNTFVYTYDTVPFGASVAGDDLVSGEAPFADVPLDEAEGTDPAAAPGEDRWYYRSWSDRFAAVPLLADWLEDSTSSSARAINRNNLDITGEGTGTQTGSFPGGASSGEWIQPGSPTGQFTSGNVYLQRATVSLSAGKTEADSLRIFGQENGVAAINQTYVVTAGESIDFGSGAVDHPFNPNPAGTAQGYLNILDPIDADLTGFNDGTPANDLFYLHGYDIIDITDDGQLTASMTAFEVAEVASATYNQNEVANPGGGSFGGTGGAAFDGSDNASYDGWRSITVGVVPLTLVGGIDILRDPGANNVTAGSISTTLVNPGGTDGEDIQFVEFSNFAGDADDTDGASDLDIVEVDADSTYRVDYTLQATSGAADSTIPDFRMRVAYPVATFSIEFVITPTRGNAFPSEGVDSTLPLYFTAPPQYASGADPALVGQENDLQLVFGPLDTLFTDGSLTINQSRVQLLGADDPNIDY